MGPGIITRLINPLASGSYLVISHATTNGARDVNEAGQVYQRAGIDVTARTRAQIETLFAGLDLVEPGVVWVPAWRPESPMDVFYDHPERSGMYAGVARKV